MTTFFPQGPIISNSNYNSTKFLKVVNSIISDSFSVPNPATPDTNTVLSGGTLSNLNDPVLNHQGATYAYVQDHCLTPSGPNNSIQFNNSGVFGGSDYLSFDNITDTLTVNKISNGVVTIGSGTITGLSNVNKNYIDNYNKLNTTTINTSGVTTYNAENIINGIIYRNNQKSGVTIDIFPSAAQIINASKASIGTTINFSIKNISSDYTSIVKFSPGIGITFDNSQNIFSGYEYSGVMIVTGAETLTLYTLNCGKTNTGGFTTLKITDFLMITNIPTIIESEISRTNIVNKVNYLSPIVPTNVVLQKIDKNMIGMDFYIINESSIPRATITLIGSSEWILDPNSSMKIPPGMTGWFMTSFKNIYTLGIFPSL